MTLRLDGDDTSANLGVKTGLPLYGGMVLLGQCYTFEYQITMDDFMTACWYVLTNTDLQSNDPRLAFIEKVKKLAVSEGYNHDNDADSKRLAIPKEQPCT